MDQVNFPQNQPASPNSHRADYSHGYRRPQSQHQEVVDQASQAAQRLVSGYQPPKSPLPQQQHQVHKPKPQVSSFEFIKSVPPPVSHQARQEDHQPNYPPPEAEQRPLQPSQPQYRSRSDHDQALPTDLPAFSNERQDSFTAPKQQKRFSFSLPKIASLKTVGVTAAAAFVLVGGLYIYSYIKSDSPQLASVKGTSDTKAIQDDEGGLVLNAKPHEEGNAPSVEYYRTSPSYPRVISVPKMNLESRILPLSLAATGALKAPATIFDAGWYKDSAKPGEDGVMIINGHTAGEFNKGIFYNLETLKKGDLIEVEDGSGNHYIYVVQETVISEPEDLNMSKVMVPYIPGKKGLNLINSGGRVDPATQDFEKRVVVFAIIQ